MRGAQFHPNTKALLLCILAASLGSNIALMAYCSKKQPSSATIQTPVVEDPEIHLTSMQILNKFLTADELKYVLQRQWTYVLSVNTQEISQNTTYINDTHNVQIMIAEIEQSNNLLPESVLAQNKIYASDAGEKLTDFISISAPVPYSLTQETSHNNTKYYYNFSNVPKGTIISLSINPILKEKIPKLSAIQNSQFEIIVTD